MAARDFAQKPASSSLVEAAREALRLKFPAGVPVKRWRFRSPTDGAHVEAALVVEVDALVMVFRNVRTGEHLGERRFVGRLHRVV